MKTPSPLSLRLEPVLHRRLEECAKRTKIKKYTLALLSIEAAVDAIEKNGYKLVVPIEFNVAHVAAPAATPVRYPEHRGEHMLTADAPSSSSEVGSESRRASLDAQALEAAKRGARRPK